MSRTMRCQTGFTMVEILVALVIGVILTAGTIQIFSSSRRAYQTIDALSRVQEDGRYALQYLARDIRNAAATGCHDDVAISDVVTGPGAPVFNGPLIQGTEGGVGNDAITIRRTIGGDRTVTQAMPTTSANMFINNVAGIGIGDVLMVTDCRRADVFAVTNTNQGGGNNLVHNSGSIDGVTYQNASQDLSRAYNASARVYSVVERTYSIVNQGLQRTDNGANQVLVGSVQGLEIVYGVDIDNDDEDRNADTYVDASNISTVPGSPIEWEDVVAVRVSVTVVDTTGNATVSGNNLQHTFSRTIGVRNRLE